ncbi:MAG: dihydrodipicolinate synthase family protein [bacterium]
MKKLKGIIPPIPTPFIDDEIAFDKLEENISKWNQTELAGYVVFGSNGESAFLTREEKIDLIKAVKSCSAANKLLIAGTGSDSIKETIFLSNKAADAGADFALVLTPSFYKGKMNHQALIDYFTRVADSIAVPLIIYNVPKFTEINISAETVSVLSQHPNIAGIKNSSENIADTSELVFRNSKDFSVLVGTASVLYPGFCVGAVGGIVAVANIAPHYCINILKLFEEDNHEEALSIQQKIIKVNRAVTAQFGVAGLKKALDMLGYFGGEPRAPLQKLNDNEVEILRNVLAEADLL